MAGMPEQIEYSTSIGGAGQYFKYIEEWLNHADSATRRDRRSRARARVGNFAGITPTNTEAGGQAAGGVSHFNAHWRAGSSGGWWPNITPGRVNSQMSSAFGSALASQNDDRDIRLKWDCSDRNLNAYEAFWATATVSGNVVWIDIRSPRAPGGPS